MTTIIVSYRLIVLYRLRWIHYEASGLSSCMIWDALVYSCLVQVRDVEMLTKRIRETIEERPKYRLTTARRWCRNLQPLKRANVLPEWSCGSCVVPDDEDDEDDDESWRWMEEGGSSSFASRDWQTEVPGGGDERRKENSARKKLKTKRKE